MWSRFPHMVEFANLIREKEATLPSTEQILQAIHKNLRDEFIDFGDYAAEEFHGAGTIDTVDRLQPGQIQSHHILLASLSDCACCDFTPTPVAHAFGGDVARLYYDSRFPKAKADEEQWVSNVIIRVAKVGDRLRAFVETGLGSFREFDSPNEYSARSRLFVPCNPLLFLKNEIELFNEILAEQGISRERVVQEFFEQHSQFLRLLGFKGFRPQVRLRPASIDGLEQSPSLAVDFLVEQIVGKPHAVVELKRATARMTSGGNRRRPAAELVSALRQLEDYYSFFSDRENREWFTNYYGTEIKEPDLVLIIGSSDVSNLGFGPTVHSPVKNLPVRLLSFSDIMKLAKTQGLLLDGECTELE